MTIVWDLFMDGSTVNRTCDCIENHLQIFHIYADTNAKYEIDYKFV